MGLGEWGGVGPYRAGRVHVCADLCKTCVFRPGNLMQLQPGRLRGMVEEAVEGGGGITCHATLDTSERAVCRGFFDRHQGDVLALELAVRLGVVSFIEAPT